MTARDHNKLLGIFFLIQGGLCLFAGILVTLIYGGMGAFILTSGRDSEAQTVGGVFLALGLVLGVVFLAFAGFVLLTGWKIYKEQQSGRTMGIIASVLSLLSFPLGTALGVYGLWFLLGDMGKNLYERGVMMTNNAPPTPKGWQ